MAGILQLRRGLKSTYISEGTNLAEAFFVTTAETGSVSENTLIVGVSGSVGDDVITLAKLSLANKDNTYADYNSGSFWITGDYTGSNALIHRHLIVSGNTYMEGDLHLEGHLFLGSGSDDDVVRVQSEFSGSIIPDNDITGSVTASADTAYYDLGSDSKRYRNIYLQKDANGNGFLSGSHIDLTGNIKVDGEGRFGTLRVDDLTDNRILLAGVGGEVEDDANLTYDGQDFRLTNSDFYQSGSGASFQFNGSGMDITGSISNFQLRVDNGIVFTNSQGTLDNQSQFTWDGGLLNIDGGISASQNLSIGGEATLGSAIVKDLTENRILIAGPVGEIEDDQYFRYTGNEFIIGSDEHFKVVTLTGNTFISGAVQMFSTLNVDDQSTLSSLNVEDLTDNRVVIVGAGGEIEDDGNFTFNGTELNIGTGNFTVQQGSGDVHTVGNVDIDLDLNIDGGDLTTNQSTFNLLNSNATTVNAFGASTTINLGTGGQGGGLTTIGHDLTVVGDLTIQGETTQLNTTTLNVEDKNILIASGALDSNAANGAGITIDGANITMNWDSVSGRLDFNDNVEVEGNLYVDTIYRTSTDNTYIDLDASAINFGIGGGNELQIDGTRTRIYGNLELDGDLISKGNISGSSFNGTTLLSSSNENFTDYSQSVDSRLDVIETTFSSSVDSRLDELEGPFSTSVDSRLVEIYITGSDHESRINSIENIQEGYLWVGDADGVITQFATSSLVTAGGGASSYGDLDYAYVRFTGSPSITNNTAIVATGGYSGSISYNTATGIFTLEANKTYKLKAVIAGNDEYNFSWYNETEDYNFGTYGYNRDNNISLPINSQPVAEHVLTPSQNLEVSVRGFTSDVSPTIDSSVSHIYIEQLGVGAVTGATTGSNSFVGNQEITGSVNITNVLNLSQQDPLPSGTIGDLAVSGSNLFFYNGAWTQVI